MKQRIVILVVISLLLAGCSILERVLPSGEASGPTPAGNPEPEATRDLGQPDGVALAFLDAWKAGDYAGMYSLLSPNSQAEYTLEEFTDIYESAAGTMQLVGLETLPSAVAETTATTAQFQFRAIYTTRVLGDVEQDLTMLLVSSGGRWGIAWSPALIFPQLAGGNTLQLAVEVPSRANIYDRDGMWLVSANASAVTLTVVPGQISTNFEDRMLLMLSEMLRMSPDEIRQQYAGLPTDWVVALGDVDLETFNAYRSQYYTYPGLDAFEKTGRRYFDVLAPHVVGYVQQIPAEQLQDYQARGYRGDELVGMAGLELWGEEYLAGKRGGVLSAYTPGGEFFAEITRVDPQPAQSLYTTLDRDMQAFVQDAIEEAYLAGKDTWVPTAGGAAGIVMDVNSGAILAMASYPMFDPNVLHPFNNHPRLTEGYITDLLNNPLRPFLNRATQGQYPPGSVFKIVSMAAALDSGVANAGWTYNSTGSWGRAGLTRYDWKEGGHGLLNLSQALTASCNTCFYELGYETGLRDFNIVPQEARLFGFGDVFGLEIAEQPGLVPDPDWMWRVNGRDWTLNDSVNIAIGQGDLLVTPTQVAVMMSAIANGGTVYRPYLVDRIGLIGEEPSVVFEPEVIRELDLTDDQLALIRESLHAVVSDPTIGTAEYRLGSLNNQLPIAGKTGTAQVSAEGAPPIAWFAGFAPYDNPEIAIVVMVENGGQGSSVAAPIFRRIVERWYGLPVLPYPRDWGDPELFDFVTDEAVPGE
ncbi:MAG: penicillin-binding protein 2 [Anaerolineae bacterium]